MMDRRADGQTDKQTDTGRQQRQRLRIASRGKNLKAGTENHRHVQAKQMDKDMADPLDSAKERKSIILFLTRCP